MRRITILIILLFSIFSMYSQDLKITEIMYNPANSDNAWEWVEIYNAGNETIDLSGYVIDDNSGAVYTEANIVSGTLEPGKSAILFNVSVRTEEQFREAWGMVDLIPVHRWSALNNGGDSIGIWSSFESYTGDNSTQENTVERVVYDDTEDWPVDDGVASIYLTDLDLDNNLGSSWALSVNGAITPLFDAYTFAAFGNNQGADVGSPGVPTSTDTENPVITCTDDIVRSTDEDSCDASFPIEEPTATDNVSTDFVFEGIRNDALELTDPFPLGETEITWTATDDAGNISESCVQKVTSIDEVPPVISCPENISVVSSNGNPVMIEITSATATDSCMGDITILGLRSDKEELEVPYPLGETTIEWQAVDASNNAVICIQTIVVNFNASMDNDITVFSVPGQSGETVIDLTNKTVLVKVPFGIEVSALVPTIGVSADATVSPANEVAQDFTNPVIYTVSAQDRSAVDWTVTVEEEPGPELFSITDFILVNADTDEDILSLTEGMRIDINELPTLHLDIRANTTEDVESVRLSLSGAQSTERAENLVPYALYQDFPTGDYKGNDFVSGAYTVMAVPYSENNLKGDVGVSLALNFELFDDTPEPELSITDFVLVNADTDEDILSLTEDMRIDINELPTLHLDIRANTTEDVESVRLSLSGAQSTERAENLVPYALYQDFPTGDYKGNDFVSGAYTVMAVPYSENNLKGDVGVSLALNFELFDDTPEPELSITDFVLVNADTNEDLFPLVEGMVIDINSLPTLHLDIRANTTEDVESVRLSLSGAQSTERTENLVPYALYQDFPIGDYKGNDFVIGSYAVKAVPYSENISRGDMGSSLTVGFELIDPVLSIVQKEGNTMRILPNPSSGQTNLSFKTAVELLTVSVFDLQGRLVQKFDGMGRSNAKAFTLGLEGLYPGNYIVIARDKSGNTYQKQMVIKE